jgi:Polyphosphate kinase
MMTKSTKSKFDKKLLINRELSSLEFNKRVMEEAYDSSNPLLERARFLAIVSSNLDEFTMVRVAGVWDQILAGLEEVDESGFTPGSLWKLFPRLCIKWRTTSIPALIAPSGRP